MPTTKDQRKERSIRKLTHVIGFGLSMAAASLPFASWFGIGVAAPAVGLAGVAGAVAEKQNLDKVEAQAIKDGKSHTAVLKLIDENAYKNRYVIPVIGRAIALAKFFINRTTLKAIFVSAVVISAIAVGGIVLGALGIVALPAMSLTGISVGGVAASIAIGSGVSLIQTKPWQHKAKEKSTLDIRIEKVASAIVHSEEKVEHIAKVVGGKFAHVEKSKETGLAIDAYKNMAKDIIEISKNAKSENVDSEIKQYIQYRLDKTLGDKAPSVRDAHEADWKSTEAKIAEIAIGASGTEENRIKVIASLLKVPQRTHSK